MYTEKEVIDALEVLKGVCRHANGECAKCMLRTEDNESCGIIYGPDKYVRDYIKYICIVQEDKPRRILA